MKKILCCLLILISLLLCSCESSDNNSLIHLTMNHDYEVISKYVEYVEVVYDNGSKKNVIEKLDYQKSIDFLKEFSSIEYKCDSVLSIMFISPDTLSAGLQFRIKQSNPTDEYQYFSVVCGPYICEADEYYDLMEIYCPDDNIEYYREIEPYNNTD